MAKDGVALKAEWRMAPARHCWASSLYNCSSITVYQYHVHHDHIRILLVMTLMFMYYNNSYSLSKSKSYVVIPSRDQERGATVDENI